ncbi:hypothetical protein SDC9_39154 [bioreactor metagenome]|uniref:Uncharacterized protein n=1 Tax=bioreactor metagenome TaxID=1076179 RepID=A0A644VPA4_9ZZZZ
MARAAREGSDFVRDRVRQRADARDLDLADIAVAHPQGRIAPRAHPARRARDDHVTRKQRQDRRTIGDQPRDRGDEQRHIGVLHHLPVQPRLQMQRRGIGDLVRGHHPGPEGAGAGKSLARHELMRVLLPVAHRGVVVAGIARDVIERLGLGDAPARLADDHRKLALVVELVAFERLHQRRAMADLAAGIAREEHRVRRLLAAGFLNVVVIVQTDADDLVGVRDHRVMGDGVEGIIGRLRGQRLGRGQIARGEEVAQRRRGEAAAEIDDAGLGDKAIARAAVFGEGTKFHGSDHLRFGKGDRVRQDRGDQRRKRLGGIGAAKRVAVGAQHRGTGAKPRKMLGGVAGLGRDQADAGRQGKAAGQIGLGHHHPLVTEDLVHPPPVGKPRLTEEPPGLRPDAKPRTDRRRDAFHPRRAVGRGQCRAQRRLGARGVDEAAKPHRGLDIFAGIGLALALVGIKQRLGRRARHLALTQKRELPVEVRDITGARAHPLPHEGRRLVAGIARQQQPPLAPVLGDERVEDVDRGALEHRLVGSEPVGEQFPHPLGAGDLGAVLARLHGDLPPPPHPRAAHIGRRPVGHAILDRVVAQLGLVGVQDYIDDQPAFVEAVILHPALDIAAHERTRPVTADDIFRRDMFDLAARHVLEADLDPLALILDEEGLAAGADGDARTRRHVLAQDPFQIGLVEAVIRTPALRPFALRPRPVEQQIALGRDEAHARVQRRERLDLLGDADPLEDPHHLGIEMHRARQVIGGALAFEHQNAQPALRQQMGERGARRPVTDDGNVIVLHQPLPCLASSP